jgi:hypothetical protein
VAALLCICWLPQVRPEAARQSREAVVIKAVEDEGRKKR